MKIKNFIKEWGRVVFNFIWGLLFFAIVYLLMAEKIDVMRGMLAFLLWSFWGNKFNNLEKIKD